MDLVLSLLHIHLLINNQKDIKWAFVLPILQSFIDDFYRSGTDAATNLSSVKQLVFRILMVDMNIMFLQHLDQLL